MNQNWIEWQLKNAGADKVVFQQGGGGEYAVHAVIGNWAAIRPYKSDRETVIALTRAIREHKAGK